MPKLVGTKRAGGCGVASLEIEDRVEVISTHGHVMGGPAKEFGVEGDGGGLVGGGEFDPTKVARGVFGDVWHSGSKVLRSGGVGKGRTGRTGP